MRYACLQILIYTLHIKNKSAPAGDLTPKSWTD